MVKDADTRIRLGSMEVSMITEQFIQTLKLLKDFAPQFHLSLQSGSNAVLKSMNRHYTREAYLQACERIYQAFPNASITTDIIVGFPTETQEDFVQSLAIVEEAGFSQIHAFPYSPREGTNAYKKYKELPSTIKKERVEALLLVGEKQKQAYLNNQIGQTLRIVPEREENGVIEGYAENYVRVYALGKLQKQITQVCVERLYKDGVWATVLE
jgi:threonylcarbamoyladenosine tRNA methylthiotransferase MtaB